MFEIDKDVPMPTLAMEDSKGKYKYPFSQMEVGDSFFCLVPKSKIENAACVAGFRQKKKFKVIGINKGFRVWRIA